MDDWCVAHGKREKTVADVRANATRLLDRYGDAILAGMENLFERGRRERGHALLREVAAGRTQAAIAEEMGVSPARVRQICAHAMQRLWREAYREFGE